MKFICLGYAEEKKWETMPQGERDALVAECLAYDAILRKDGHFAGGEALQSARNARTLRWQNGKVIVTDGPYAETKEQIGGILVLEARDLDHAVELMSRHPGVRLGGPFEIRPSDEEFTALVNTPGP
ncbi:MAG: YciI family protein [Candidatus Polarisedimenticolia bacterium]